LSANTGAAKPVNLKKIRDGGSALYVQIAGVMRRKMRSGEWPPGIQLPTLEQLAEQLGVARVTVRQAMDLLETEQLIWRRQGKGTFVTTHAEGRHWMSVATDWDELVNTISGTESRVLLSKETQFVPRLGTEEGAPAQAYQYQRRLHSYHGEPHLVIEVYLDRRVYQRAREKFEEQPIIPVLAKMPSLKLGKAHQTLMVSAADVEIAKHLRITVGSPIVEVRRVIQDRSGTVIYFADLSYRADNFRLEMKLRD